MLAGVLFMVIFMVGITLLLVSIDLVRKNKRELASKYLLAGFFIFITNILVYVFYATNELENNITSQIVGIINEDLVNELKLSTGNTYDSYNFTNNENEYNVLVNFENKEVDIIIKNDELLYYKNKE